MNSVSETLAHYAEEIAAGAKQAAVATAKLSESAKNRILAETARQLRRGKAGLLRENAKDIAFARQTGLSAATIDRLTLTEKRIEDMALSVEAVMKLRDPIGAVIERWRRPNGLRITKVRVPLGVILIIYEARPNVTQECAALCLKSGNSVILKGGKEAFHSNRAIAGIFRAVLKKYRVEPAAVTFVENTERQTVDELLKRSDDINLVIPRGGESLIRKVAETSRIPVIKHYKGICHVYIDRKADLKKALAIAINAKCQRPSVCNAMETLLVHKDAAAKFLPAFAEKARALSCELRGDEKTRRFIPWAVKAAEQDWHEEYLDLILAVRVVDRFDDAVAHIQKYGSAHTDAIVTEDKKAAREFVRQVDSSSVMVNASTRFSDGFQYGFGAEIGISTDKIHARGPMGLEGLTSYKYVVEGNGQLRS